jgi:uptake hydrogenase large subunit
VNASVGFGALGPGALAIAAEIADGRISSVRVASTRPANLARLFVGREAKEAPTLAERLFSLCGVSHRVAAQRAVAVALGETLCMRRREAETLALLGDKVSATLRAMAIFAFDEGGGPRPDIGAIRPISEILLLARELCVQTLPSPGAEGPNRSAVRSLTTQICALGADLGLPMRRDAALADPKKNGLFDHLWRRLSARGFGAAVPDALCAADDAAVLQRMRAAGDSFAAAPALPGRAPETGAFARRWDETDFSRGALAARLQARMIDLAESFERLERGDGEDAESTAIAPELREGFAAVETSRGRLCHWTRLDARGRVAAYTIVAPTEWNFHPAGPFVAALLGAPAAQEGPERPIVQLAGLFDPCVPFRVTVREAESA